MEVGFEQIEKKCETIGDLKELNEEVKACNKEEIDMYVEIPFESNKQDYKEWKADVKQDGKLYGRSIKVIGSKWNIIKNIFAFLGLAFVSLIGFVIYTLRGAIF